MNNDIQFEKNNIVFNYRVAIIIRAEDKLLVQKNTKVTHFTLPGGRCTIGENSVETAIRELKEETGLDSEFVKSIGIIENFFRSSFNGKQYHEILLVHELKFLDSNIFQKENIANIEKKEGLSYSWLNLDELKTENFHPSILLDMLNKDEFQHYINKD